MTFPECPFGPVALLFLAAPVDSELLVFLQEAHRFLSAFPHLVARVEADLDAHGRRKKAMRMADAAWIEAHTALLAGAAVEPVVIEPERLRLLQGREPTW